MGIYRRFYRGIWGYIIQGYIGFKYWGLGRKTLAPDSGPRSQGAVLLWEKQKRVAGSILLRLKAFKDRIDILPLQLPIATF